MPPTIIQTAAPALFTAVGCPRCYSRRIFPSQTKNLLEQVADRIGIHIMRCRQCFHRFLSC